MLSSIIMTICRYFTRNILQFKINVVKIIGIITIHYTLSLRTRSHLLSLDILFISFDTKQCQWRPHIRIASHHQSVRCSSYVFAHFSP